MRLSRSWILEVKFGYGEYLSFASIVAQVVQDKLEVSLAGMVKREGEDIAQKAGGGGGLLRRR